MKILFKLAAIATAFGLASGASAQAPSAAAAPAAPVAAAPAPAAAPAASNESTAAPATANVATPAALPYIAPTPDIGQPNGNSIGLQPQVSPIGREASWFHNSILLPLIIAISVFVLLLMLWVVFRYRRAANPVPSRNSHNTTLEIVWTLLPVLILVAIAVPSIRLLSHQYDPPRADLTVKAIGNQWYWDYEYPDYGVTFTARMLPDDVARQRGEPRQLGVDNRVVVPVGAVVKMIITSNDVIHAWGVPAFWVKIDAVPGRLNETWFRADREGVYYGVCYELCGAQHGFMPIAVEVVSRERFNQWVASQGGHPPAAGGNEAEPAAAAAPAANTTAAAPAPTGNVTAGAETPATTNQSAATTR